jgi:hypothetical protein
MNLPAGLADVWHTLNNVASDVTEVSVGRAADLSGATLVMAQGVVHLDPATAVFEGMLEGWARQQRSRFPKWDSTIKPRLSLVRRLAKFSNQYLWEWRPAEVEAFFDNVRAKQPELHCLDCAAISELAADF